MRQGTTVKALIFPSKGVANINIKSPATVFFVKVDYKFFVHFVALFNLAIAGKPNHYPKSRFRSGLSSIGPFRYGQIW